MRSSRASRVLKTLTLLSSIMMGLIIISLGTTVSLAESSTTLLEIYGEPLVVPIDTSLDTIYGSYYDEAEGKVLIIGSKNATTISSFIDIITLKEKSKNVYPLLGSLTALDVDVEGAPRLYALGTDKGEVVVISRKDLNPIMRYVHGEEALTRKVFITDEGILVTLMDFKEGKSFIKIFKITESGWVELGEFIGNAPLKSVENLVLVDAIVLKNLRGIHPYTGNVLATAYYPIPAYRLKLKVLNATSKSPMENVRVYVRNEDTGEVFFGLTGKDGVAFVPVSMPLRNITIFIEVKGICYYYMFEKPKLKQISPNTYVLTKVLEVPTTRVSLCPVITRNLVIEFDKLSDREPTLISRFNLSNVASLKLHLLINATTLDTYFKYVLVVSGRFIGYPVPYVLRLIYLDNDFKVINETIYRLFSDVTSATYSADGYLISLGTKEGTTYVLGLVNGTYKLLWSYRAPSTITSLTISSKIGKGYILSLGSIDGNAQFIYVSYDTLIPLSRINLTLFLNLKNSIVHVQTSSDANVVVITTSAKMYLVLGLGNYVKKYGAKEIDLSSRMVQPLTIKVVDPQQRGLMNASIALKTPQGKLIINRSTNALGFIQIDYILPGKYVLEVNPLRDYLRSIRRLINVSLGMKNITLTCSYKAVPVRFSIYDRVSGNLLEDVIFRLTWDNKSLTYYITPTNNSFSLNLVPGIYGFAVEPSPKVKGKPLYKGFSGTIRVPDDRYVDVTLERNSFKLTLLLVDALTHGPPREPLNIVITDERGNVVLNRTIKERVLDVTLNVKGLLNIEIRPIARAGEEPYYVHEVKGVELVKDLRTAIMLKPNMISVTLLLIDSEVGGPPIVPLKVLLDDRFVANVKPGTQLLRLNVTKGLHKITISSGRLYPQIDKPFYNETSINVNVTKHMLINVSLERLFVNVTLMIKDYYSGRGPLERLTIFVDNVEVSRINASPSKPITIRLPLPKGLNTIVLKGKKIYTDYTKKVTIKEPTNISIGVIRKAFNVRVIVVNDIGQKVHGGQVKVNALDMKFEAIGSIVDGEANLRLPYGDYRFEINQPGYMIITLTRPITSDTEIPIVLTPTPMTLLIRYLPVIAGIAVIAAVLGAIYKYRAKIRSLIAPEEELF